jgi:hypothetical protein
MRQTSNYQLQTLHNSQPSLVISNHLSLLAHHSWCQSDDAMKPKYAVDHENESLEYRLLGLPM